MANSDELGLRPKGFKGKSQLKGLGLELSWVNGQRLHVGLSAKQKG